MLADAPSKPVVTRRRLTITAVVVVIVAVIIVVAGVVGRNSDESQLNRWTAAQAVPSVRVIQASTQSDGNVLVLPGRLEAFYRAPIYARVSGYLKSWSTDIGAQVKAGEVLGVIETPDLDQQFEQAKANLASARADEKLAATTAGRWQAMLKSDSVSQQATDEKAGDYAAKQAAVNAAAANLERLQALEKFKRIVAPFDGVVTSRDTDVGALIDAGGGKGPQLFTVSDIHQLRVYVDVPQAYAASIRPGMMAKLSVPGHADASFTAKVLSTSGAVNLQSGALLVELTLDDNGGQLMPGDFATVRLALPAGSSAIRVPATALIFRADGLQVATLDANDRVSLHSIKVQRDLGGSVEVASGVTATDRIVDNPPDALSDGDVVNVMPDTTTPPAISKPVSEDK